MLTSPRLTDNVDYNSLKYEIKIHTRRDQARAITIPGHSDAPLRKFEDGFYAELCRQHDRVDMFVGSKAAEVSTRLGAYYRTRWRSDVFFLWSPYIAYPAQKGWQFWQLGEGYNNMEQQ